MYFFKESELRKLLATVNHPTRGCLESESESLILVIRLMILWCFILACSEGIYGSMSRMCSLMIIGGGK